MLVGVVDCCTVQYRIEEIVLPASTRGVADSDWAR